MFSPPNTRSQTTRQVTFSVLSVLSLFSTAALSFVIPGEQHFERLQHGSWQPGTHQIFRPIDTVLVFNCREHPVISAFSRGPAALCVVLAPPAPRSCKYSQNITDAAPPAFSVLLRLSAGELCDADG